MWDIIVTITYLTCSTIIMTHQLLNDPQETNIVKVKQD
ncbi:putative ORfan [Saudi moumouvirus]|nr:putative ORfan [Saudi moumouvirus]